MHRNTLRAAIIPALLIVVAGPALASGDSAVLLHRTPLISPGAGGEGSILRGQILLADADAEASGARHASIPSEVAAEQRGVQGARAHLQAFAAAIESGDFGRAWAMLGPIDRQESSPAAFASVFSGLHHRKVAIEQGTIEGAAGTLYYTAPIIITYEKGGRRGRMDGQAILRRANDVPGASPAELRWHFERLDLKATNRALDHCQKMRVGIRKQKGVPEDTP